MRVTRSFKSGNSVAVRLPRELDVAAGTELEIEREGDVIHIRPKVRKIDVSAFAGAKVPGLAEWWRDYEAGGGRELEPSKIDWTAFNKKFGRG